MKLLRFTTDHISSALPSNRSGEIGLLLALFFLLSAVYVGYLHQASSTLYPLHLHGIVLRAIIGSFLLVGIGVVLPSDDTLPSTAALVFVYIFLYTPAMLYYVFAGGDLTFTASMASVMAVTIALLRAIPPISFLQIDRTNSFTAGTLISIILMVIILVFGLFSANGLPSLDPLLYQNTYQIRAALELPPFSGIGYVLNWVPKVILPFLAAYFWYKEWLRTTIMICLLSVIVYLFSPQKLLLAALPFAGVVLILAHCRRLLAGLTIISGSIIIGGYIIGMITDTVALSYLPSARLFFIQGRGQHLYVEFFNSGHPHLWLTTTPINPAPSPYPRPVSYLVSQELLGNAHNMNSGIFGDAYAHAGLLGVIALGPLIAGTGRLLDGVARQSDWRLIFVASATPLFALTQVGFTIAIATNGILFAILLGAAFGGYNSE